MLPEANNVVFNDQRCAKDKTKSYYVNAYKQILVIGAVVEEGLKLLLSLSAHAGVVIVHPNGSIPSPQPIPYLSASH